MERGFGLGVLENWFTSRLYSYRPASTIQQTQFTGDSRSRKRPATKNSEGKGIRRRGTKKKLTFLN